MKKIKYIVATLLLMGAITGCDDFLTITGSTDNRFFLA